MKHILIVPDKFKGSLTSLQAAHAIRKGLEKRYAAGDCGNGLQFQLVEIADGGDGSLDVVAGRVTSPQKVSVKVHDPLFREVTSQILLYGGEDSPLCAFIEMAKISGLAMLEQHERNPLNTSTYGFGEAIRKAQEMGAKKITLSIGGSATDDCGAGMLQALGFEFFNRAGELIPVPICGKDLQDIGRIASPEESVGKILFGGEAGCKIEVICDVDNPLLGENGATAVYAPQKGATPQAMEMLERGKANMAAVAERCLNISPTMKELPGAGAAGGVGYAGTVFLGGELLSGWRFFTEITSLEEKVQWADVVVTGEGSVDSQSLSGKIVGGIMELAQKYGKPVEIFCGVSSLRELPQGVRCHSLVSIEPDTQICMTHAAELLERLAKGMTTSLSPYYNPDEIEAGCDEAGRGCLAGPVFAAAVILPKDFYHPLLNDSKQLTAKQREKLRPIIEENAIAWGVCAISPQEIDKINILKASIKGMHGALDMLEVRPTSILVDGNRFYKYQEIPHICMVKGDARFASIAAASVLAKTYRDEYMLKIAAEHPQYGWDRNMGYPTKEHRAAIAAHGPTLHHRMSFKLLEDPTLF